jgi:DNA-binding LacI/PurR family transcriptional regulator
MPQVTLHDVATASGVSAQTVSRVINQRPDVSAATRARVWETIRRLGYKPNVLARGLVSQRSHVVGIITLTLDDFFRAEVLTGLEKQARAQGYACQMTFTNDSADDLPELVDAMLARQVDGIALLTPKHFNYPELHLDVPVVAVAHTLDNPRAINVDVDNVDGAYQAVRYLLSMGHQAIGQISGPMDWIPAADRIEGARRALAEHQLAVSPRSWVECQDWTLQGGYDAARRLLAQYPELTAIFCHNDLIALGAYRALREANRRIPDDVSVIGYDDLPLCQFINPPLASVRQPSHGLGQLIAQLLITAIEHAEPYRQDMLVPAELMVRGSVVAPCLVT